MDYLKIAQQAAKKIEERNRKMEVCSKCGGEVHLQGMCYDCLERHSIKKEHLGKCSNPDCSSPAWDIDAEGKAKCWSCLAVSGLFGTH
jgi:hypothetical protein